jgi:putative FmdB family regulatory protein
MPIYEYGCNQCGKRTEILQRMNDAPLAACPECGGEVRKLVSASAFQFKGSGWYATDYASKKGGGDKESKSDSNSESSSESKSETKGETKSESKSEGGDKAADKPKEAAPAKAAKAGGSD